MSYLFDFVKTFTEDELKQFKKLDLVGRQELVRDLYAGHSAQKKFNEADLPAKLGLSQSHFDKINSVLLDKAIEAFFGNDYGLALYAVLHKGLSDLVLHELRIMERKIATVGNRSAQVKFYKAAFDCLRSMYHPKYDPKLTRLYGRKYLKALGSNKNIGEECYVAMITLYGDMVSANYAGKDKSFKADAWKELEKWRRLIARAKSPVANFYYYYVLGAYYKHLTEDAANFIAANENALNAFNRAGKKVEDRYKGVILCELGFGYIASGRYAESQQMYANAISNYADSVGKSAYHPANYLAACVINRDFKMAETVFKTYLEPKIQPSANRSLLFDIYSIAGWLYLNRRNTTEAFKWLNLLNQVRKNQVTLYGQSVLRHLETTYYYLLGDDATTARLVKRNLKFLNRQSVTFNYHKAYIDIIGKLLSLKHHKLRSPEKLRQKINALPQGLFKVWNAIIEEEFEKLYPAQRN